MLWNANRSASNALLVALDVDNLLAPMGLSHVGRSSFLSRRGQLRYPLYEGMLGSLGHLY